MRYNLDIETQYIQEFKTIFINYVYSNAMINECDAT
jgi:hypothetical protein